MSVIPVDDECFEQTVSEAHLPVLVDFWAERCLPCVILGDMLDEVAVPLSELVTLAKINVDENPVTSRRFGVRSVPTLIILDKGEVRASHVGSISKSRLVDWVESTLRSDVRR